MKIDFEKYTIIGCIPKEYMNEAPTDQTPCIIEKCPICNKDMWVSSLKREYRKSRQNVKTFCFVCIAKEQIELGLTAEDVEIANLAEFQ